MPDELRKAPGLRHRITRRLAVGAIALAATLAATSCSTPPDLSALPTGAIAAISVGQVNVPGMSLARAAIVTFSANGGELGRLTGPPTTASAVFRFGSGLFAVPGDRAAILTPGHRRDTGPGGRRAAVGARVSPDAQSAVMWNSSSDTRFVLVEPGRPPSDRTVSGRLQVAGFCGGRTFAMTATGPELSNSTPTVQLHELNGAPIAAKPQPSVDITLPAPLSGSGSLLCDHDGRTLLGIVDPSGPSTASPRPQLVRIDPRTGTVTTTAILQPADAGKVNTGTATVLDEHLYWFDEFGSALTLRLSDPAPTARRIWQLPTTGTDPGNETARVYVSGTKALAVSRSTYAEYDLRTGEAVRTPVHIPWLANVLTDDLEVNGAAAL